MTTVFEEYTKRIDNNEDKEDCFYDLRHEIWKLMKNSGCNMEDIDLKVYYKDNIFYKSENRIKLTFSEEEFEEMLPHAQNSENDKELTNWIAAYYNQDFKKYTDNMWEAHRTNFTHD